MSISISARGRLFEGNPDLVSTIEFFQAYESIYSYCLNLGAKTHGISPMRIQMRLTIKEIRRGSLNVVIDVISSLTPLAPEIIQHAWSTFEYAYSLLMLATDYFNKYNKAMPIKVDIIDSSNASVEIFAPTIENDGSLVIVHPDVYLCAKKQHKNFNSIASLVKNDRADEISISSESKTVRFSPENQNKFEIKSIDRKPEKPIELICSIYRLNVKKLTGYLEYYDENTNAIISRPFDIAAETKDSCINALRVEQVEVAAIPEYSENALGERRVKRFHIQTIHLPSN